MSHNIFFNESEHLRLEVEREPLTGEHLNYLPNPSGTLGGHGWFTPTPGSAIRGERSPTTGGLFGLIYTTGAYASNIFESELIPVTVGWWVRAQAFTLSSPGGRLHIGFRWYNAAKVSIGNSTVSTSATAGFIQATSATQVPAGAVYATYTIHIRTSGDAPWTTAGSTYVFRDARFVMGATSGGLPFDLSVAQPAFWTNILAPTHEISVDREELNLGTLSATVLDATIDPATASLIRPGRGVRLMCLNTATALYEPMFTGDMREASVTYALKDPHIASSPKHARISLTAVDNIARLASVPRAGGVGTVAELPWVLEDAGVPWVTNGNSGHVTSATQVSTNDNATALDQVAITRDSRNAVAWVDRYNTLQVFEPASLGSANKVPNPNFATNTTGWAVDSGCTIARQTSVLKSSGVPVLAVTSTGAGVMSVRTLTGTSGIPVVPSIPVKVSLNFHRPENTGGVSTPVLTRAVWVAWYNAAGTLLSTSAKAEKAMANGVWSSVGDTFTPPATAAFATIYVRFSDAPAAGHVVYLRSAQLRQASDALATEFTEADYSDLEIGFETARCINSVGVKILAYDAEGTSKEHAFGPFRNSESVRIWGDRHADFTVHGMAADNATAAAFANKVLAANAAPTIRVTSLNIPIRTSADLSRSKALIDLMALVVVTNDDKNVTQLGRVAGIKHAITPNGWMLTLTLTDTDSVAAPSVSPPPQASPGVNTGWQTMELAAGWAAYGTPWQAPQFRVEGAQVWLRGLARNNSGSTWAPGWGVGFVPEVSTDRGFPAVYWTGTADAVGRAVLSGFTIQCPGSVPHGGYVFLDGINYRTD